MALRNIFRKFGEKEVTTFFGLHGIVTYVTKNRLINKDHSAHKVTGQQSFKTKDLPESMT